MAAMSAQSFAVSRDKKKMKRQAAYEREVAARGRGRRKGKKVQGWTPCHYASATFAALVIASILHSYLV